jgi:NAD(P)-dependent dehydrogenase (short-subunit alcohol dehydrogenase family)
MIRPATAADLDDTVRAVDDLGLGTKVLARQVDVRDLAALEQLAGDAVEQFGAIDVVVANAGIFNYGEFADYTTEQFTAVIDVNLTGVWNTCKATVPHMIAAGRGGSVIIISSTAGLKGQPFTPGYTAAKHGLVGLAKGLANELGEHSIRVNTIHPAGVQTAMGEAPGLMDLINRHQRTMGPVFMNTLPVEMMEPAEISNAVAFLASDESRMMTGTEFKVDCGMTIR